MPDYFLTPPKLDPLGLDLAEAHEAGTYCPTEIEGTTPRGREVYIRYRWGTLTISIAEEPGAEAVSRIEILCERLGPQHHGTISLEQVCRIAGITVNGEVPVPARPDTFSDYAFLEDLSGETTFYERDLVATEKTALAVVNELLTWSDARLVEARVSEMGDLSTGSIGSVLRDRAEDVESSWAWIVLGPAPTPRQLAGVSDFSSLGQMLPECMIIEIHCGWLRPYSNPLRPIIPPRPDQAQQMSIQREDAPACRFGRFTLLARFLAGDARSRAKIGELDALLETAFPHFRMEYVDIVTGEWAWDSSVDEAVDCEIIAFLEGGPNRYRSLYNSGTRDAPRWTGSRPKRVM